MPIKKVKGGYKWGKSGKVYPTKAQAAKQARAAYASGYKSYQTGGSVTVTEEEEPSAAVQAIREADKKFKREFAKYMLMSGIMSDPKIRQKYKLYKTFRDQGPMGLGKALGQRAGIEALFRKVGPWAMLLQNKGGPLGLGIVGSKAPMSSKIMQGLLDPRVAGRMKFAQAFPQIAGIGFLLNKLQPRIEGQKGILGQGLGPQLRNLFSRILPIKSYEEKYGMGSAEEDMYPDIQPIEVTAQKRAREPRKPRVSEIADMIKQQDMYGGGIGERLAETGGDPSAYMYGLVPGAAQSTNQGLRAANFKRRLAKMLAKGKTPKKDFYQPDRKISSGGASRK